jgi:hypothetical protein
MSVSGSRCYLGLRDHSDVDWRLPHCLGHARQRLLVSHRQKSPRWVDEQYDDNHSEPRTEELSMRYIILTLLLALALAAAINPFRSHAKVVADAPVVSERSRPAKARLPGCTTTENQRAHHLPETCGWRRRIFRLRQRRLDGHLFGEQRAIGLLFAQQTS